MYKNTKYTLGEKMNYIKEAKKVFDIELGAIEQVKQILDNKFTKIVEEIISCKGKVILCGMGKSGHIAKKISASMASLGTPSFFLHPADALHGDLGMVAENDVIILISHSGESDEIVRLIPSLKMIGVKMIGITSRRNSTLANECDIVQIMPEAKEACAFNLAPTSSTTAVLVYGDALAIVTSKIYGFNEETFALFHPAGTLGKQLLIRVKDIMSVENDIPCVMSRCNISDAIVEMSQKKLGVVTIKNKQEKLIGILTDGDLRRAIENKVDLYNGTIDTIMTKNPKFIYEDILAVQALKYLRENSINNFPVVDKDMQIIGVLTWQQIVKAGVMI